MPAHNGITISDVQELQKIFAGGIKTWEYEVLKACRNVMQHGHGSFSFEVHNGEWRVAETTRMRGGKI